MDNLAMHDHQPEIPVLKPTGQRCVIETEQVQQRGVQIVDVDRGPRKDGKDWFREL